MAHQCYDAGWLLAAPFLTTTTGQPRSFQTAFTVTTSMGPFDPAPYIIAAHIALLSHPFLQHPFLPLTLDQSWGHPNSTNAHKPRPQSWRQRSPQCLEGHCKGVPWPDRYCTLGMDGEDLKVRAMGCHARRSLLGLQGYVCGGFH